MDEVSSLRGGERKAEGGLTGTILTGHASFVLSLALFCFFFFANSLVIVVLMVDFRSLEVLEAPNVATATVSPALFCAFFWGIFRLQAVGVGKTADPRGLGRGGHGPARLCPDPAGAHGGAAHAHGAARVYPGALRGCAEVPEPLGAEFR